MQCPKCKSPMEQLHTPLADVERCTGCKGLWLDMLEHEDLAELASTVDSGDPVVGAAMNSVDRIYCPVCPNSKLIRMVDPLQPHIWFESCPTCYGRYLDAGELTDLSERSFDDFLKKLKIRKARD